MCGDISRRCLCGTLALLGLALCAAPAGAVIHSPVNGSFEDPVFSDPFPDQPYVFGTLPTGWQASPGAVDSNTGGMAEILHHSGGTYGLYAAPVNGSTILGLESQSWWGATLCTGVQQDLGTMTTGQTYKFSATLFSNTNSNACGYHINFYNVTDDPTMIAPLAGITQANFDPSALGIKKTVAATFSYTAAPNDQNDVLRLVMQANTTPAGSPDGNGNWLNRTGVDGVAVSQNGLIHRWSFNDGTAKDSVGTADGALYNGATVSAGALHLDGVNQYVRTTALNDTINAKTLVAWVSLANLNQKAGGVLSLENPGEIGTETFDSITYAERTDKQWMAGSDGWTRSGAADSNGGVAETSTDPVMVAISYAADGQINIYHNGVLYASYTAGGPLSYANGVADVVLGLRHELAGQPGRPNVPGTADGTDPFLAGSIDEARIYEYALSAGEIGQLYAWGPNRVDAVPEPGTFALLGIVLASLAAYARRKWK